MLPGDGGAGSSELAITEVDYNESDETVTIVFNSSPGRSYALFWSPDMQDGPGFTEINDNIPADAVENQTTYQFPVPRPGGNPTQPPATKAFFFIRQN